MNTGTQATTLNEAEEYRYMTILAQFQHRGTSIPGYMFEGIVAYLVGHCRASGFLKAVITNDLLEAVRRADDTNIGLLPTYVSFFYNEAPGGSYGSPAAYDYWTSQQGDSF